jgi:hypothetical protein
MMHKIMLSLKFGENLQKKGYYTMPTLYKPGPASHGCVYTTESCDAHRYVYFTGA